MIQIKNDVTDFTFPVSYILSIALIFCVVFGCCSYIGFPIIFPDSGRYLWPAYNLNVTEVSPGLYSFLLRPLYLLCGPWAFVIVNSLLLAVVSVLFSRFLVNKTHHFAIFLAVIFSAIFIQVSTVMMDIQSTFGILAIYLFAKGFSKKAMAVLLFISIISHSSAIPFLLSISLLVYLLTHNLKAILQIGAIFVISMLFLFWHNSSFGNHGSPLQKKSKMFVVARLMADYPQSVETYLEAKPDSKFKGHWQDFKQEFPQAIENHDVNYYLFYGKKGFLNRVGSNNSRNEANDYIFHTLSNHFFLVIKGSVVNVWKFLSFSPSAETVFNQALVRSQRIVTESAKMFFPNQQDSLQRGAQYNFKIKSFYSIKLTVFIFCISVLFCLGLITIYFIRRRRVDRQFFFEVPLLAVGTVLLNAIVMSNLGGIYGRYQLKVIYIPILFTFISASFLFERLNNKDKYTQSLKP